MKRIPLSNSAKVVLVDDHVYQALHDTLGAEAMARIRLHSSGRPFHQRAVRDSASPGGWRTETTYLGKWIAENFIPKPAGQGRQLAGFKNGDPLDCRLDNVCWRTRAVASRLRKTSNKTGYTGVYKEHHKYRAVISVNRKTVHIGMFDTAEDAARAYNAISIEKYGESGKVNTIK